MPTGLDMLGHIGYVAIAFGLYLIAKNNILGWALRFIGELIWLCIGIEMGMTSIWLWGIAFCGIDALGWYQWRKGSAK